MSDISKHLTEEKSVALFFPKHVPWYDFLAEKIRDSLHRASSSNKLDIIDVSDKNIEKSDEAGRFIAEKYCDDNKLGDYWLGESYAKFLAGSDDIVLNNTYVWIKGVNKNNYQAWCDFVEEYESGYDSSKKRATFLLEYFEETEKPVLSYRKLHIISWEHEIKSYDYYMFCSLLVSDLKFSDEVKHYIAELAYLMGECHAEFCAFLTEQKEKFAENPMEVLEECAENFRYSDGSKIELVKLYTAKYTVLEVQIKNLFPVIERYRIHFITDNYPRIKALLPIENSVGEEITEPYDLEIGGLRYMVQNCSLSVNFSEWNDLKFFHESRNKIAHNNIIEYQEVKKILDKYLS